MWSDVLKKVNHRCTPQKAVKAWGGKKHSVTLISEGINLVYRFEINDQPYYLRITHSDLRRKEELVAALEYQEHLFLSGVKVCEPVKSLADHYIETITQGELDFLVHVNKGVPGTIMNFAYPDAKVYRTWGKTLAILHKAAQQFEPSNPGVFKRWQDLWQETNTHLKVEDEALKKEFTSVSHYFAKAGTNKDNFGIVHHDHRLGNVLYDGETIHIIDFDEPIYHWFGADIIRPFLEVLNEGKKNIHDQWLWYIEGYVSYYPLGDDTLTLFPWLLRMKNLEIYLWLREHWGNEIAPGGGKKETMLRDLYHAILNPKEVLFS